MDYLLNWGKEKAPGLGTLEGVLFGID